MVVSEVEVGGPLEQLGVDINGVQGEFNALVIQHANVGERGNVAGFLGEVDCPEKVVGAFVVCFDSTVDTVFKHSEVEAKVQLVGLFPCEVGVGYRRILRTDCAYAAEDIVVKFGALCNLGHESVVANILVPETAYTQTQLEVVDLAAEKERFFGNLPCECRTGEEAPLVAGSKLRGAVCAHCEGEKVAILEAVGGTGKERCEGGSRRRRAFRAKRGRSADIVVLHRWIHAQALSEVALILCLGSGETAHHGGLVRAFFEVIGNGILTLPELRHSVGDVRPAFYRVVLTHTAVLILIGAGSVVPYRVITL